MEKLHFEDIPVHSLKKYREIGEYLQVRGYSIEDNLISHVFSDQADHMKGATSEQECCKTLSVLLGVLIGYSVKYRDRSSVCVEEEFCNSLASFVAGVLFDIDVAYNSFLEWKKEKVGSEGET